MSFLLFNFSKNFIYVVIYWILDIPLRISMNSKVEYFTVTEDYAKNEYIFFVFDKSSDLLSIFLVLYIKYKMKSQKEINEQKNNDKNILIYNVQRKAFKKNFFVKIIIIALLECITYSCFWISYAITGFKSDEINFSFNRCLVLMFDSILRYIFGIFILKNKIHKHGKFSLILMIMGFGMLLVADLFDNLFIKHSVENLGNTLLFFITFLLRCFSFPYEHTLIKQIFLENFILPESLQFYRGIIEILFILVITPILFFSLQLKWDFHFEIENILITIYYIITSAAQSYIILKVIYFYSSQSVSFLLISQCLGNSITSIVDVIREGEKREISFIILEIIAIFVILFAVLIYDEVIIINKWNLNKNVRISISHRSESEMSDIENDNEIDDIPQIDNLIELKNIENS